MELTPHREHYQFGLKFKTTELLPLLLKPWTSSHRLPYCFTYYLNLRANLVTNMYNYTHAPRTY